MNLEALKQCVNELSESINSDVYMFSGEISFETADIFIEIVRNKQNRKTNCALILTTYGGDPNAGYRMARTIKRYYEYLTLYVYGLCKSTGTLIALAADQIVMSDFGEFGPLDIQLLKDDELSNTSGLSYLQSLSSLNEQTFIAFERNFLNLKQRSGFTITTKTAAEISTKLATGMIAPISAQLDPVKLGEVQRAISIAQTYGIRLCDDRDLISRLIAEYPSHGFVIDFEEAKNIFPDVRFVEQHEAILERILKKFVRIEPETPAIQDLVQLVNEDDFLPFTEDPHGIVPPIKEEIKVTGATPNNKKRSKVVVDDITKEQNNANGSQMNEHNN